jgi:hypothetical protein
LVTPYCRLNATEEILMMAAVMRPNPSAFKRPVIDAPTSERAEDGTE